MSVLPHAARSYRQGAIFSKSSGRVSTLQGEWIYGYDVWMADKQGPNSIEKNPTEKPTEKPTENPTEIPYTKKKSKNV